MNSLQYLHLQLELEGISVDGDSITMCQYPEESPLIIIARTFDGESVAYIDKTLPSALRHRLSAYSLEFSNIESVVQLIRAEGIRAKSEHFKTYVFPESFVNADMAGVKCFLKDDPKIIEFGFGRFADKIYTVEIDSKILSACVSVRQNSKCEEAWVFTTSEHRRKGLAQQVVIAWSASLIKEKIIPFYSHDIKNVESARLAGKLGLYPAFEEIVVNKES